MEKQKKAVIVTTAHRGVFFGYVFDKKKTESKDSIELVDARLCVYWSSNVKGFMGLAVTGPLQGCRIGPKTKKVLLHDITAVLWPSKEAIKAWESDIWS